MKRRIFIAINLPDEVKNRLAKIPEQWPDLPVRWTKPEHLHITLAFVGYVTDEQVPEIAEVAREIAKKHQPFSLSLMRIETGPPGRPARMIWASGAESAELTAMKNDLENQLACFRHKSAYQYKTFHPHVTLARVIQEAGNIKKVKQQFIPENVNIILSVQSIEIMESALKRSGAEYAVLKSVELGPH